MVGPCSVLPFIVESIAFVLPGAPQKRAALCAEMGSAPVTSVRKERLNMTYRKRTTAIQVRVTEQEKRKLERQAKRCGLSLSGYLRRVGVGKSTAAFLYQRFHALYQRSAVYAINSDSQPLEPTVAQLDELSGQILSDYAG